jgi:hypothetical protein
LRRAKLYEDLEELFTEKMMPLTTGETINMPDG